MSMSGKAETTPAVIPDVSVDFSDMMKMETRLELRSRDGKQRFRQNERLF
jgi:hypothetical protein